VKKIFFVVLLLSLGFSLCSCGKRDNGSTLFQDNFEYAIASPWVLTVPVNGWSNTVPPNDWNIVGGGVSGNALQYLGSGLSQLANNFSGSDYKISVQFMPVNLITDNPFCLAGRIDVSNNCYLVCVNDNGSNVYLDIEKYNSGSLVLLVSVLAVASPLNSSAWYTLTMTLKGTTITGDLSGGTLTETTLTATDSTYPSGKVGILVSSINPAFNVLFDDYLVVSAP
jgi:pectate lyase